MPVMPRVQSGRVEMMLDMLAMAAVCPGGLRPAGMPALVACWPLSGACWCVKCYSSGAHGLLGLLLGCYMVMGCLHGPCTMRMAWRVQHALWL